MLVAALLEAGDAGLPVSEITQKSGISGKDISSWFCNIGKKKGVTHPSRGHYAILDTARNAFVLTQGKHEQKLTPTPEFKRINHSIYRSPGERICYNTFELQSIAEEIYRRFLKAPTRGCPAEMVNKAIRTVMPQGRWRNVTSIKQLVGVQHIVERMLKDALQPKEPVTITVPSKADPAEVIAAMPFSQLTVEYYNRRAKEEVKVFGTLERVGNLLSAFQAHAPGNCSRPASTEIPPLVEPLSPWPRVFVYGIKPPQERELREAFKNHEVNILKMACGNDNFVVPSSSDFCILNTKLCGHKHEARMKEQKPAHALFIKANGTGRVKEALSRIAAGQKHQIDFRDLDFSFGA